MEIEPECYAAVVFHSQPDAFRSGELIQLFFLSLSKSPSDIKWRVSSQWLRLTLVTRRSAFTWSCLWTGGSLSSRRLTRKWLGKWFEQITENLPNHGEFFLACEDFGSVFDHLFPGCTFFFFFFCEVEIISSRTLISLFMPKSVQSGSASCDDCGRMFPDKLRVSSFPDRFPHYAWTAA